MQSHYGFELYESNVIDKLEKTQWPENEIQGTPWYALMSNPIYVDQFSYIGPHVKDRNEIMRDSDFD